MTQRTTSDIKADIQAKATVDAWDRNMRPLTADEKARRRTTALATLRQDIWEATQWVGLTEIERFCASVVDEVRSDLP